MAMGATVGAMADMEAAMEEAMGATVDHMEDTIKYDA